MTDAPRISDDEVTLAMRFVMMRTTHPGQRECMKAALAAFLAARVPEPKPYIEVRSVEGPFGWRIEGDNQHAFGFNACRDIVLSGRAEGK